MAGGKNARRFNFRCVGLYCHNRPFVHRSGSIFCLGMADPASCGGLYVHRNIHFGRANKKRGQAQKMALLDEVINCAKIGQSQLLTSAPKFRLGGLTDLIICAILTCCLNGEKPAWRMFATGKFRQKATYQRRPKC